MQRLLRLLRSGVPGMHALMEDLVDWADSGAPAGTGRHLERCTACRIEAMRIRRACRQTGDGEITALASTLERLQTRMRAWRTVEVYFGRKAAGRLAAAPDVRVIKPMFSAFLGAAAADALARHIAAAEC